MAKDRGASPPKGITPERNQPTYTEKMRSHKKGRYNDMRWQFEDEVTATMKKNRSTDKFARNEKPKIKPPSKPRVRKD